LWLVVRVEVDGGQAYALLPCQGDEQAHTHRFKTEPVFLAIVRRCASGLALPLSLVCLVHTVSYLALHAGHAKIPHWGH